MKTRRDATITECLSSIVNCQVPEFIRQLPARKMKQKLPFKFSYKVTDTFYAGEYPFEISPKDGIPKLNSLIGFGVTTIIDLTSERLTPYAEHLPETCTRLHFPTIDYTSPDFSILKEIHTVIDEAESRGEKIYVHCKGGHDRTGVVVASYFIHTGLSPQSASRNSMKSSSRRCGVGIPIYRLLKQNGLFLNCTKNGWRITFDKASGESAIFPTAPNVD